MEMTVAVAKIEFDFVQPGEFDDPYYDFRLDGKFFGDIRCVDGLWQGALRDDYRYGAGIFSHVAEKIDQLNDSLDDQRKQFFGL